MEVYKSFIDLSWNGIVTSFPDPEEHEVPLPESSCEAALALDGLRLSCFVSSLEVIKKYSSFFLAPTPTGAQGEAMSCVRVCVPFLK